MNLDVLGQLNAAPSLMLYKCGGCGRVSSGTAFSGPSAGVELLHSSESVIVILFSRGKKKLRS